MYFQKQHGMSLVSVLMLSTLAATVAFTALNTAITQNRISGNFQKNLNAQQQAEQAIFDSYHRLNHYLQSNPEATAAELAIIAGSTPSSNIRNNYIESTQLSNDQLLLGGKGAYFHDSVHRQNAKLTFNPAIKSTPITPFDFALTGCDSVDLNSSGAIQSYDSTNPTTTDSRADVRTVNNNANMTLTGNAPIDGDVLVRGDLTIKNSSKISGNVQANGRIILEGASTIAGDVLAGGNLDITGSSIIKGNVRANGDITLSSADASIKKDVHAFGKISIGNTLTILGEVRANDNISITNGATIGNGIKTKANLTVTGDANVSNAVLVEGNISILKWVADGNTFKNKEKNFYGGTTQHNFGRHDPTLSVHAVEAVPSLPANETDSTKEEFNQLCDPLNLPSMFQNAAIPAITDETFKVRQPDNSNKRKFVFNGNTGTANYTDSPDNNFALTAQPFSFGNEQTPTFFLKGLELTNDAVVTIVGNVRLFLEQDMTIVGDSQFIITPGSRLTILTAGKITISNGGSFCTKERTEKNESCPAIPQGLVNGKPVLAIYSNYQSQNTNDTGILLSGDRSGLYAAIYAPASHIKVTADNSFAGSAVGKTLNVDGAGFIRYDQALKKVNPIDNTGPGNQAPRVSFKGF